MGHHGDHDERHDDRTVEGHHEAANHPQMPRAINAHRIEQLLRHAPEIFTEQEHGVGAAKHERQHERPECIAHPHLLEGEEQRHDNHDLRNKQGRNKRPEQHVTTGKLQIRKRVGRENGKNDLPHKDHRDHLRRHGKRGDKAMGTREKRRKVLDRRGVRKMNGALAEKVTGGTQRRHDRQRKRRECKHGSNDEDRVRHDR